jgi:glycine/D-amino acid oxidase-like deaminating enzyme
VGAAEVAVVGAGVTGLSCAWHLAESGAGRVVVYERTGIGAGASGVQPGGVRQQWGTRVNCLLARHSLSFYRGLAERLQPRIDPAFRACGYLFLAHESATLGELRRAVAIQNDLAIPSRILPRGEAAAAAPGLGTEGLLGASWCAEDGYFDRPQGVVEAFAEAARRLGVEVELREVTALERRTGAWMLRFRDGGAVDVGTAVLATGADTPGLVRPLGIELPIVAESRHLFYSDSIAERLLEPLVVAGDRGFAAKQLADGRLLASDLSATGDPAKGRERWRAAVRTAIEALLPRLQHVALPHLVSGTYDVTPDRQPVVGVLEEGLLVAAGFSGHGFMFAPEIGRGIAEMLHRGAADPLLSEFRPDRFGSGEPAPETLLV